MQTGNNDKLLKLWSEVSFKDIVINKYWEKYNKGGAFRRWYGNSEHVVYWKDKGLSIIREKGTPLNSKFFNKSCFVWSRISNSTISFRKVDDTVFCHDSAAVAIV